MKACVLVLAWNGDEVLPACLRSLAPLMGGDTTLVCIDNGSIDRSRDVIRAEAPHARLIENERNLGFAGGMNRGIRHAMAEAEPPDVIILLNQDTVVADDWLTKITAPFAADDRVGAVGCKVHYPDGRRLQHAGAGIDDIRATTFHIGAGEEDGGQYDEPGEMPYVTGAALALRRTALDEVGLLDSGFHPAYYEEVDLCLRLREAGWRIRYEPAAVVAHQESASIPDSYRRAHITERNRLRYVVKNWPVNKIRETFLPAERAHLDASGHNLELATLRRAYLDAILHAEEWLEARRTRQAVTAEDEVCLRSLGAELRRHISARDGTRAW